MASIHLNSPLPTTYTLWFHSSSDNDWTIGSYHEIFSFSTPEEFWTVNEVILSKSKMLLNGMFFIMKQGIKPMWEDSKNSKGGCVSWKLEKPDVPSAWENMAALFVTKDLGDFNKFIPTGISISPKKNNNIIKLWVANEISQYELEHLTMSQHCLFKDDLKLYKSHKSGGDN
jgi:translation initiation factor 4E